MKKVLTVASAGALVAAMALPAAAQSVPLNTVTGGAGQTVAEGQAGTGLLVGGSTAAVTTGLVIGLAVLTVVAASEESTTSE